MFYEKHWLEEDLREEICELEDWKAALVASWNKSTVKLVTWGCIDQPECARGHQILCKRASDLGQRPKQSKRTGRSVVVSRSEIQGYTEHVTSSNYGNRSLYTLKVDVAPKFICWNPIPSAVAFGGGASGKGLGHKSEALRTGLVPLKEGLSAHSSPLPQLKGSCPRIKKWTFTRY